MRHLQIEDLKKFGGVPFDGTSLSIDFPDYSDIRFRLSDLEQRGDVIRLKNGVFCLSEKHLSVPIERGVVANALFGPSIVSFESALRHYGAIPEFVPTVTSAVAKRGKRFDTPLGAFVYHQVPSELAPVGIRLENARGGNYLIANPTRALCDVLMRKRDLRISSPRTLHAYLEEDLRCDLDAFGEPDVEVLDAFASCGRKSGLFTALRRMFI